ncbi:endo-xylogalacturonan hydrolase A [Trichoderma asperellum]|uniref:Endo-xylogalacturonan hydrolase A n=1 Tax=Trichoderma asperellum TaxID=101201 RepID=A0A6V8R893_TRIAP|nr:glycoside hydrolase family 28 protein [Trichoderma asperelloides]GFP60336.1 endo-xylogalacturonan hydrolase A [Trichoderma asperellum]
MILAAALIFAVAAVNSATVATPQSPTRMVKRASTCTPVAGHGSSIDDTPAIQSAIASCPSGTIVIPKSTTYHINTAFSFTGCSGCTLQIDGTLQASSNTTYWGGRRAIFLMDGITGATVFSATGTGVIDGNGQAAWDLFAANSSYKRPTLFYINNSRNVKLSNLHFKSAPNVFHSVTGGSSNVSYSNISLYAVSASANVAHNTDGWDIGQSTHVTIEGAVVTNDDDCVALKAGCSYATVTNISCTGSHGISVGSLGGGVGSKDKVENCLVRGATMINSAKAAGLKLYSGPPDHGTAVVSNVTFENFVLQNTDYAFQVQSCYGEDTSYCDANPSRAQIADVVVRNFSGTTSTHYSPNVANLDCPAAGTCGLSLSNITVTSPKGSAVFQCANTPSNLGVTCTDGASG